MTENEAIEILENFNEQRKEFAEQGLSTKPSYFNEEQYRRFTKSIEMAISSLSKIQQYRALGTVGELRKLSVKGRLYEQVAWERDIAISQLEEIGCSLGEKMDEVKKSMEKQRAKKPIKQKEEPTDEQAEEIVELGFRSGDILRCPCCGEYIVIKDLKHCMNCGQNLDWS